MCLRSIIEPKMGYFQGTIRLRTRCDALGGLVPKHGEPSYWFPRHGVPSTRNGGPILQYILVFEITLNLSCNILPLFLGTT